MERGLPRLPESYGRQDAAAHRGLGAGDSTADLAARFAMNDAAGIDHQILSVSPQGPSPQLRRAVGFLREALPSKQAEEVLTAGARLIRRHET
ncbi:hypothetical protein OG528_36145 [Streptomyces platensis]|uniref:hypothetical protein n=1 Tax=Streptomyces platensis TaxID=58346 RepID=UPI0030DE9325